MSLKQIFALLVLLAFSRPAFAQRQTVPRGGVHTGGAVVPPGQQRLMPGGGQRQLTPQEYEYLQHLWFIEMMESRGGAYKRPGGSTQTGGRQQTPSNNQATPNLKQPQEKR